MKPLYIAATLQDSGKTCLSLGLMQVLKQQGISPGYCKPVGQHFVSYAKKNIDEDSVLMHQVFKLPDEPYYLSPIAIERGFTRKFIFDPDIEPLEEEIVKCRDELSKKHPLLIIEGTGHAGVGSCFGLSNARVAEILGAKVVIVTAGGIGRPIDEIALNLSLFRDHNVEVMGIVLNKIIPEKYDKVKETVAKGLENIGTKLIGAIPFDPTLTFFTMGQLVEEFKFVVFSGKDALNHRIENTVIAAMEPQNVVRYIKDNTLIITPGDRVDNILVSIIVLSRHFPDSGGLILTGGMPPHDSIAQLLKNSNIPVLISDEDTFKVSSKMSNLGFKIRTFDEEKISNLHGLIQRYVSTEYIFKTLKN